MVDLHIDLYGCNPGVWRDLAMSHLGNPSLHQGKARAVRIVGLDCARSHWVQNRTEINLHEALC